MITEYVRGRVFNYSNCLGGTSAASRGLFFPSDFALGSNGALYVVNKAIEFNPSAGVTKLTLDSEFIWDRRGLNFLVDRGPLPSAIGLDSEENVYVADEFMNQIWVFDVDGNTLANWGRGPSKSGDRASKKTLVYRSPFSRILQHQYSTKEGVPFDLYLKKVSARDTSADGDLNGPMGLRFDNDDNLFISDSYNHRVQVFAKDGTFLRKFGEFGDGYGQLNLPWGLDIDSEGCVFVADWRNRRVQKFSPEGDYMATIGGPGTGEGELERPSSVAIDKDGDVYVTDLGREPSKDLRARRYPHVDISWGCGPTAPMAAGEGGREPRHQEVAYEGRPVHREDLQEASRRACGRRGPDHCSRGPWATGFRCTSKSRIGSSPHSTSRPVRQQPVSVPLRLPSRLLMYS